ncbi:hypothetical protein DHEL01_v209158 [Diaporthe helianthi]|uniref:DUF6546 domain-containing protein n=1 Tax=Diaporthe helianthi TaxID=158607 RepID=A0A2P5HQA1_DIAHE|nr:hypothetical protein DHEL01_v209158 [Diaporthe helianthi]
MAHVPTEIILLILKYLNRICRREHRRTCTYASVCRLWQEFFEKKHFSKLSLTWLDFPRLKEYVVGGRRKLVKRIKVEIPFRATGRWQPRAGMYVYMIKTLFETLGTWWDVFNSKNPGQMVLEISVCHRNYISPGILPQHFIYTPLLSLSRTPPAYAVERLVLHPKMYDVFRTIPRALHYLMRSLPALRLLTSENRVLPTTTYIDSKPLQVYEYMFRSLPVSVTELRLCSLGLDLARVSRQLKHLTASFVVDAKHFFQPFWPEPSTARPSSTAKWVWDQLETLALTSELLRRPLENEKEVNHLLEAISLAVRRMPRLLTLEIWNGDDHQDAFVFCYSYSTVSRRASLTIQGTRQIYMTQDTERSWGETIRQKTGLKSEIQFEKLDISPPFMAEAVCWFLELRGRVATDKVWITPI